MCIPIDGGLKMFVSIVDYLVNSSRRKGENPNRVRSHCVIYREALSSRTLTISLKDRLATIVQAVNYVKESVVNIKLFIKLCKDMYSNHETLLFYIFVRWLLKVNMFHVRKKKELMLFFLKFMENKIFSQLNQSFLSDVGRPRKYFRSI